MLERLLPTIALSGIALSGMLGCASLPEPVPQPKYSTNGHHANHELDQVLQLYGKSLRQAAQTHSLDYLLIAAVIRYESNANNDAISSTGCTGLMQVCRGSAASPVEIVCPQDRKTGQQECYSGRCKQKNGIQWCEPCLNQDYCVVDDRFYPRKNIDCGTKVLKGKLKQYKGKYTDYLQLGIAAYNAGEGVINEAIKATGKSDPRWEEVYGKVTISIFRKFQTYNDFTNARLQQKITELDDYVTNIVNAYRKYKEQEEVPVG